MNWFIELFTQQSVASTILVLAYTIVIGLLLGRIKIGGVSLGITWILFVGILMGHLGVRIDPGTLHFVKEFGLILFVYAIGLQVGPGFFASFRKGGLRLNLMAVAVVLLGMAITVIIKAITNEDAAVMAGIYTGAVTNTPALGAAQQTYADLYNAEADTLATGYAAAYPLGVVCIILACLVPRWIFRIRPEKEQLKSDNSNVADRLFVRLTQTELYGKKLREVMATADMQVIIALLRRKDGKIEQAGADTELQEGDILFIESRHDDSEKAVSFFGEACSEHDFNHNAEGADEHIVSRKIIVTNRSMSGMKLGKLNLRTVSGVNITRVTRSGIDLVATEDLQLQMGDRVSAIGEQSKLDLVASLLGNSQKRLNQPNLIPIFLGIFLGIILGMVPIKFPGLPMPIKLGLAGGPLIVAILIGRFGPHHKMPTYISASANLMLREVGIALFLAAVGLGAGEHFVETIVNGGYMWVLYGIAITLIPLLIVGIVARGVFHLNYFTLMGMLAGSTTDPPALAYANGQDENEQASVAYATVYPLTMFLRILSAQLLVLML